MSGSSTILLDAQFMSLENCKEVANGSFRANHPYFSSITRLVDTIRNRETFTAVSRPGQVRNRGITAGQAEGVEKCRKNRAGFDNNCRMDISAV